MRYSRPGGGAVPERRSWHVFRLNEKLLLRGWEKLPWWRRVRTILCSSAPGRCRRCSCATAGLTCPCRWCPRRCGSCCRCWRNAGSLSPASAGRIAEEAFLRCREHGFPTGAEMCIHQGNRRLLRETVRHLAALGCRAALGFTPDDILAPDKAACAIFRGGWIDRIVSAVQEARPGAACRGL